jgi:hypothetical protein
MTTTNLPTEGRKQGKIQGFPRVVVVREISAMQMKNSFRKGCQIFSSHMEEETRDKVGSIEYHLVLRDFEDFFWEIPRFPPKRDIYFSIDLVLETSFVSNTPYKMSTLELKELKM